MSHIVPGVSGDLGGHGSAHLFDSLTIIISCTTFTVYKFFSQFKKIKSHFTFSILSKVSYVLLIVNV